VVGWEEKRKVGGWASKLVRVDEEIVGKKVFFLGMKFG
jgi:hypothetical protein